MQKLKLLAVKMSLKVEFCEEPFTYSMFSTYLHSHVCPKCFSDYIVWIIMIPSHKNNWFCGCLWLNDISLLKTKERISFFSFIRTVNQNNYFYWKEDKLDVEKAYYKIHLSYLCDILWLKTLKPSQGKLGST